MNVTFDNEFQIANYGGKLFKADNFKFGTTWDIPGVEPATPEGKEIQKLVETAWKKEMDTFKKAKEKEYKEILAHTERALYQTATKKAPEFQKAGDPIKAAAEWLTKEAQTANVMIKNAVETFKSVAAKKMDELWVKISTAIDKKFKTKLRNAKIKAAFKIVGLAIVVVAAAALAIAGSVLAALGAPTGVGLAAGVGLALGGIATAAGAIKKIYDIYSANWPNHKTASQEVKKAAEALKTALEYEEIKAAKASQGAKLGPKEKMKIFFGNTAGKRKDLQSAIKKLTVWNANMMQAIEKGAQTEQEIEKKLGELEKQLAAEKDKKKIAALQKQCDACVKKIFEGRVANENARVYLRRYVALMNDGNALCAQENKFDSKALGSFLSRLSELAGSKEAEVLIEFGKGSKDFLAGLVKFLAK